MHTVLLVEPSSRRAGGGSEKTFADTDGQTYLGFEALAGTDGYAHTEERGAQTDGSPLADTQADLGSEAFPDSQTHFGFETLAGSHGNADT